MLQWPKEKTMEVGWWWMFFYEEEENMFIAHITVMSRFGFFTVTFKFKIYLLNCILAELGGKELGFCINFHGQNIVKSFVKRHWSAISQHTAKNVTHIRAAIYEEVFIILEGNYRMFLLSLYGIMMEYISWMILETKKWSQKEKQNIWSR